MPRRQVPLLTRVKQEMPEGWEPEGEEEEEYTRPEATEGAREATTTSAKRRRGRQSRGASAAKKTRASSPPPTPPTSPTSSTALSPGQHQCVLGCGEEVEEEVEELRSHYSFHYYDEAFSVHPVLQYLQPDHLGEVEAALARVQESKVYQCLAEAGTCTSRKMKFREFAVHTMTEHRGLANIMGKDTRPEVQALLATIFPSQEDQERARRQEEEHLKSL